MDLLDAHAKGLPLVIETGEGGDRLAAEIFRTAGGIAFADIGWPDATWNPYHLLDGDVRETDDGWRVGDTPVRIAFDGEQLFNDWADWNAWRGSDSGAKFDRERCLEELRLQGLVP